MYAKNITGIEQMEQDKEARIRAIRSCVSLLSPLMTLLLLSFTLLTPTKWQSQIQVLSSELMMYVQIFSYPSCDFRRQICHPEKKQGRICYKWLWRCMHNFYPQLFLQAENNVPHFKMLKAIGQAPHLKQLHESLWYIPRRQSCCAEWCRLHSGYKTIKEEDPSWHFITAPLKSDSNDH